MTWYPVGTSRDETEAADFGDDRAAFGILGLEKVVDFAMGKTGGKKVAAKSLGTSEKNVKITVTPKQLASSVAKTIGTGAAVGAMLIPGLNVAVGASVAGSAVGVDRLIAASQTVGKAADDAKKVIANTKALAAQGNADAKRGLDMINQVAADRAKKGIPPGKPQPVTAAGEAAFNAFKSIVSKLPLVNMKAPSSPAPAPKPVASAAAKKAADAAKRVQQVRQEQLTKALSSAGLKRATPTSNAASKALAARLSSIDFPTSAVRWTVSDAGRVVKGLGSGKGWVVYASGAVQRKAS